MDVLRDAEVSGAAMRNLEALAWEEDERDDPEKLTWLFLSAREDQGAKVREVSCGV